MILHVFLTPFTHESRALKEIHSVLRARLTDRVEVAAVWDEGLAEREELEPGASVWRVRLRSKSWPKNTLVQLLKYVEWLTKICRAYRGKDVRLVHCHSLSALPVGFCLKLLSRAPVLYDAHELETETGALAGLRKRCAKAMERFLIRRVVAVLVVSAPIARWYERVYSLRNVYLVRNMPRRPRGEVHKSPVFRAKFGIPENELIFLYQGILGASRGIAALLNAFSTRPDRNQHIVFMGYGPMAKEIRRLSVSVPTIHYHPPVPPGEVLDFTCGADVGVSLAEKVSLSYFYGLPNKLFEYLFAGLPVIVSDIPEMAAIVTENDCGWIVERTQNALIGTLAKIDRNKVEQKRMNLSSLSRRYGWEQDEPDLLQVVRQIMAPATEDGSSKGA